MEIIVLSDKHRAQIIEDLYAAGYDWYHALGRLSDRLLVLLWCNLGEEGWTI